MKAKLPSFFKFEHPNTLIRLGKKNDGGYLVSKSDVIESKFLISLGINDDWSFEKDFTKINNVPLYAFDPTVNFRFFIKIIILSVVNIYKDFLGIIHGLRLPFNYLNFFKGNRKHIKKFVGLNSYGNHTTMESILEKVDFDKVFLKIDIEGSEYRLLETLLKYQEKITGLVIEFHNCDIHLDYLEKFINRFNLKVVHIHANNFGPIRLDDGLPTILEISFSKFSTEYKKASLPHILDMPNNKFNEEIKLSFN